MSSEYINYNEISISNLQKAEDMNTNDYFIIQPQDFNNQPTILPYKNLIFGLDNVSFASTITQHSSDIISLSSDISTVSSDVINISSNDLKQIRAQINTLNTSAIPLPDNTVLLLERSVSPNDTPELHYSNSTWVAINTITLTSNTGSEITCVYWMKTPTLP